MSPVSAKRVSSGTIIDCSHLSKRSSPQGIHRETDAANGIAMPYITFLPQTVKQPKKTTSVPNLPTSLPPRAATNFTPSHEALKFLSALFYKNHTPLQHGVSSCPSGTGTPVTDNLVGASCSTFVEPEQQLSLLSYQLQSFDIKNVQLEWSALEADVACRDVLSRLSQASSTHERADKLASLELLKKQLTRSGQAATTSVQRKALSKHSNIETASKTVLPITHSSFFPLTDYSSATPSQGSDASSVFSDSGLDESRSESSDYSFVDRLPQKGSLFIESPTSRASDAVDCSSGSEPLHPEARSAGGPTKKNGEIVKLEESGTEWVFGSMCDSLTCDKRIDKNIVSTPNPPFIPHRAIEVPRLSLELGETVIAGPDLSLKNHMPSPLLHTDDRDMLVSLPDTRDFTLSGLGSQTSEIEVQAEETTPPAEGSLSFMDSYQKYSPKVNGQQLPLISLNVTSEEIPISLEHCEPFSQTCDIFEDDKWGAIPVLRLPRGMPYHEVQFAQTTPIFDTGAQCAPICRVSFELADLEHRGPQLAINDPRAHDQSLTVQCNNGDGNTEDIEVYSKRHETTLDISPTLLEDIDAAFRARGWSVGGSWQDDEELEEIRPVSAPTNRPPLQDTENSRFGSICKNLNMTRASGGFYRWTGGK